MRQLLMVRLNQLVGRPRERSVFDDRDARDWKAEARLSCRAAALLQPAGLIVGMSDNQDLVSGERAQRIFDRFHRVGVAHASLDVLSGGGLCCLDGKRVGFGTGVVLGIGQPVEPRNLRCWCNHKHLGVIAGATAHQVTQHTVGDLGSDYDKQTAQLLLLTSRCPTRRFQRAPGTDATLAPLLSARRRAAGGASLGSAL
jgi:hypothetical protein